MQFLVRKYEPNDFEQLKELFIELQEHEKTVEPLREDGHKIATEYLNNMLEKCNQSNGVVFVAEDQNNNIEKSILGLVCAFLDEHLDLHLNVPYKIAYINDIVTRQESRGRGIGKTLVQTVEKAAKEANCQSITLNVLARNTIALRFYEELGFEGYEIGMRKKISKGD